MAANTQPVFPLTVNIGNTAATALQCLLTGALTAATAYDGADANAKNFYTAGTAGGSKLDCITIRVVGVNGTAVTATSAATVIRIWANNAINTTATNSQLIAEVAIPATTLAANSASATGYYVRLTPELNGIPSALPAGYKLYAGSTIAAVTNTAWAVSAFGGDF